MSDAGPSEVPEGAAVFPLIPPELGVDPLFLAALHATVFLGGSDEDIIHPGAAQEALEYMATYLQRLHGPALARMREDLTCLTAYARQEKWPKGLVRVLQTFLEDYGVGEEASGEDEEA